MEEHIFDQRQLRVPCFDVREANVSGRTSGRK